MNIFGGNSEMTDAVMTLAMYLLCGKDTYNQLASWQRIVKAPHDKPLASPYITMLTQKITEQDRMELVKLRNARLKNNELYAVGVTSRSTWGDPLLDIRYGKNKNRLPLA